MELSFGTVPVEDSGLIEMVGRVHVSELKAHWNRTLFV